MIYGLYGALQHNIRRSIIAQTENLVKMWEYGKASRRHILLQLGSGPYPVILIHFSRPQRVHTKDILSVQYHIC
jgi:hypothetical protein